MSETQEEIMAVFKDESSDHSEEIAAKALSYLSERRESYDKIGAMRHHIASMETILEHARAKDGSLPPKDLERIRVLKMHEKELEDLLGSVTEYGIRFLNGSDLFIEGCGRILAKWNTLSTQVKSSPEGQQIKDHCKARFKAISEQLKGSAEILLEKLS